MGFGVGVWRLLELCVGFVGARVKYVKLRKGRTASTRPVTGRVLLARRLDPGPATHTATEGRGEVFCLGRRGSVLMCFQIDLRLVRFFPID